MFFDSEKSVFVRFGKVVAQNDPIQSAALEGLAHFSAAENKP